MKRGSYNGATITTTLDNTVPLKSINEEEMLLKAIKDGELEAVQSLIDQRANINFADSADSDGMTPLMQAIKKGNSAIEKALIKAGAEVNAKDKNGGTVLHYAALFVSDNTQTLLDKGANVHAKNKCDQTPLMLVGRRSSKPAYEIVDALIQRGAQLEATEEWGRTALFYAAGSVNITALEALLARGAKVNAADKQGNTPLFFAAIAGNVKTTQALLARQANINAVNAQNSTPLIETVREAAEVATMTKAAAVIGATLNDYILTVKCLLLHGADVFAKTTENKTALELANEAKLLDMMQVLALEGSEGKNRYANLEGFLSEEFLSSKTGRELYRARQKQFKDDASYIVALKLLKHSDQQTREYANDMLNSFKTYKIDLADSAENTRKQREENNNYINIMRWLSGVPLEVGLKICSFLPEGLISRDEKSGVNKAQTTAEVIFKRYEKDNNEDKDKKNKI